MAVEIIITAAEMTTTAAEMITTVAEMTIMVVDIITTTKVDLEQTIVLDMGKQ